MVLSRWLRMRAALTPALTLEQQPGHLNPPNTLSNVPCVLTINGSVSSTPKTRANRWTSWETMYECLKTQYNPVVMEWWWTASMRTMSDFGETRQPVDRQAIIRVGACPLPWQDGKGKNDRPSDRIGAAPVGCLGPKLCSLSLLASTFVFRTEHSVEYQLAVQIKKG